MCERQAGSEIEVTPEMVEAVLSVLLDHRDSDGFIPGFQVREFAEESAHAVVQCVPQFRGR